MGSFSHSGIVIVQTTGIGQGKSLRAKIRAMLGHMIYLESSISADVNVYISTTLQCFIFRLGGGVRRRQVVGFKVGS